ncbi:hypothetical protein TVAG_419860 [Trichomonas vaginalis G3]|uniref:Uncharacterized protein n=1 Tax=Trichomonas vaginalis (strain ATCC PRA-98 / G3) TaxID=412133 RepID=A2EIW0_TRIV3|nr:endonuclease protein [Trichomonas vaginalis G3]EAY07444.1 hypothetical protein TVAG_419860 [Trichomonas vaginalis G3]KAI5484654.1 endonuclease protein [Trichomonas vaginalis G3]|eukprot:XP_001319667.1 hypothetical protein [Trichomonas vaginalis G3]
MNISLDPFLILYVPIFYSPKEFTDVFKDYAKESFQVSYEVLTSLKDIDLYQQWSLIIDEISKIMKQSETLSFGAVSWKQHLLNNSDLLQALLSFDFSKLKSCGSSTNIIEAMKSNDVQRSRNKKMETSSRDCLLEIQRYISTKEPNYEVLQWAKDNNAFNIKTKPNDLLKMIERAKIPIHQPMHIDFEKLGELYLSPDPTENKEDMTWFFHYCLYSYKSYLLDMIEEGSLQSAMSFSEFHPEFKKYLYDIFSNGNTNILQEYRDQIVEDLFVNLSSQKEYFLKTTAIRAINQLSNPSDFVSPYWADVIHKINHVIPLEIPLIFPDMSSSSIISCFIKASIHFKGFEYLENSEKFMNYRKYAIKDPPNSLEDLVEIIKQKDPSLIEFIELCKSIYEQKEVGFNFNDAMLYNQDILEFAPFSSIFFNKNPQLRQIMDMCIPKDNDGTFHFNVGLAIIRLFTNCNLISVNSKINPSIHKMLKEIVGGWYKIPSQFIVDYIMIVGNYNASIDQQYDYNLTSYLEEGNDIDKIANFIIESNYAHYFISNLKQTYPIAIRKFVKRNDLIPYLDQYLEEDGENKDIEVYLSDNFKILLKTTLGYTRTLYDFIQQFTDKEDAKNNQAIAIFGCLTSISGYIADQNIENDYFIDYCRYIFNNFDIEQFKSIIDKPKNENQFNDPFSKAIFSFIWNPIGSFTDFYKKKLTESKLLANAEISQNNSQIQEIRTSNFIDSMQEAIMKDRKYFADQNNKEHVKEEINDK